MQSSKSIPWTVKYVPEKEMIAVTGTGKFSYEDVKKQTREAVRLVKEHSVERVLVDCHYALAEISLSEIYWLPAFYDQLGAPRVGRVAVVLPANKHQIEFYQFYELRCRNTFYNVRLFETVEGAEAWLQESGSNSEVP